MLVKYELEDDIPIDESSENLQSTYAPAELIGWIEEKKWSSEVKIKESAGDAADIPVTVINDNKDNCLESILQNVENKLIRCIEEAHSHVSEGLIVSKELDNDFSALHIWLKVREVIKEKEGKYRNDYNIKLVIG
ncbi:hypothetical protein LH428_08615 [Laribacter hongkongensis]|nr:hypothetical protein [Laribacter hongkongensis]